MVGLVIMPPALVTELLGYWFFGEALCTVFMAVDIFACTASIINLCAISLDRYWSVARPADYRRQGLSRKRVRLAIVAVWVISAAICIPSLVGWTNDMFIDDHQLPQCEYTNNIGYVVYSTLGSFYLPLVIMTAAYVRVCWAVKDRVLRNKRRKMPPPKSLNGYNGKKAATEELSENIGHTAYENDSVNEKEDGDPNALGISSDGPRRITEVERRHRKLTRTNSERQHGGHAWLCLWFEFCRRNKNTDVTTEHIEMHTLRSCTENRKEKHKRPKQLLLNPALLQERPPITISVSSPTTSAAPPYGRQRNCKKLEKRLSLPELRGETKTDHLLSVKPRGNARSVEYMVIVHPPPSAESPNRHRTPNFNSPTPKTPNKQSFDDVKQRDCNKRLALEIDDDLDGLTSTFSTIGHNDIIVNDVKEMPKLHRQVNLRSPNAVRKRIMRNRDTRLIVVVGIIVSVFVLCWLPFFLTYVVQTACGSCNIPETLFKFFTWLGYCNSSLNPILYTVFNKDFRNVFYKKILRREVSR
ncbi:alpha-2C adrenergic receptor-like [Branchiostoma lanceolatum]|uniref:alpha-2C adrenergic receptor-like n=1 Tax=Branchiostoma lanceolatum TaxID=7740 RepID=UPI0034518E8F